MTDLSHNSYNIHYFNNSTMCVILILTIWHTNLKIRWGFFTGKLAQGGGPWKSC